MGNLPFQGGPWWGPPLPRALPWAVSICTFGALRPERLPFIKTCMSLEFVQRTTKTAHPWSNGKCEALNRTLKYQCFPAIAGNIQSWEDMCQLVSIWMDFYNKTRAHTGHVNRGLPPLAFLRLYNNTEGDHLGKLLALGILKQSDKWHIRLMGSKDKLRLGDPMPGQEGGDDGSGDLPYA